VLLAFVAPLYASHFRGRDGPCTCDTF
jgi:hypothetical protein